MPTQPAVLGTARLGNFRLGYNPHAAVRAGRVRVEIAGMLANARVRVAGLRVHDAINDAPNTCSLVVDGTRPSEGQDLRVYVNSDNPRLLFNGTLQTVDETYEGLPNQLAWACTAVDDLVRLNRIRPFGTWTNVSATTIAQSLIADFAPGFTSAHVEVGLPEVSIVFDGSDTFSGALKRLSDAIGGYFYVEDLDLHLFLTETTDVPDDIDSTPGRFLDNPPISMRRDDSQVRTRVYGKGHGENLITDVAANETVLPIPDAAMFNPAGGQVIGGTTPDGAQSEILDYTGVQLGGGGSLVGPGASPSSAPTLVLAAGSGVTTGSHDVATVFVTGSGKSLPGPTASITVGSLAAPTSAPTASTATAGTGPNQGSHDYVLTNVAFGGETTVSPISNAITTNAAVGATSPVTPGGVYSGSAPPTTGGSMSPSSTYTYWSTYVTALGETTAHGSLTFSMGASDNACPVLYSPSTDPRVTHIRFYRLKGSGNSTNSERVATIANSGSSYLDTASDASIAGNPAPPLTDSTAVAGTAVQVIPLVFAVGPAGTTARKLYRRFNGTGTFKLVTTFSNNTTTAHNDTLANSGLGADAPSTNTAVANQIGLTNIAIGGSGTTSRELFMSPAGGGARKLALTISNNTATTGTITVSDATLAGNAAEPTVDLSGLAQPDGQVLPGATAVIVAGTAPFTAGGGWWFTGTQAGKYTGFTGSSLTGVPASGPGSITQPITYNTTIAAAPSLVGVTGNTLPMLKGTPVHIWVERNDSNAQALLIALDAAQGRVSTGVVEHTLTDMRRGEASLIQLCDADLERFSRPIVTVTFDGRDQNLKSGKPITFNLTSPAISMTLTLMTVDVSEIDIVPSGLSPRFHCVASNTATSLESILRKLITKAGQ